MAERAPGWIDSRLSREVERVGVAFGRAAEAFEPGVRTIEEGRVQSVGDGVVSISGLPGVGADELLRIDSTCALVLGLEPERVDAVVLDDAHAVRRGARVRATGRPASIPVGDRCSGAGLDPLGRPLDGQPLTRRGSVPVERRAPRSTPARPSRVRSTRVSGRRRHVPHRLRPAGAAAG